HHGQERLFPRVHERRLREQPGVDGVEEKTRLNREVNDGLLLSAHIAAQVADESPLPSRQLLAERRAPVNNAPAEVPQGPFQSAEAMRGRSTPTPLRLGRPRARLR